MKWGRSFIWKKQEFPFCFVTWKWKKIYRQNDDGELAIRKAHLRFQLRLAKIKVGILLSLLRKTQVSFSDENFSGFFSIVVVVVFSRTTEQIWLAEINICWSKVILKSHNPFRREIFNWLISVKLGSKHPGVKGFMCIQKKDHAFV